MYTLLRTNSHSSASSQPGALLLLPPLPQAGFTRRHLRAAKAPPVHIHPAVKGSTLGVASAPAAKAMFASGELLRSHCPSTPPPPPLPVLLPPAPKPPHSPPAANRGDICSFRSPLIPAIAAKQLPPLSAAAAAAAAALLQARRTLLRRSEDSCPAAAAAWLPQAPLLPMMSRLGGEHM